MHVGKDDFDIHEGGYDIMFGYVGDETEDVVSLTRSMATRLETWYDVRTYGARWLRPEQSPHIAGGVHERCIFQQF